MVLGEGRLSFGHLDSGDAQRPDVRFGVVARLSNTKRKCVLVSVNRRTEGHERRVTLQVPSCRERNRRNTKRSASTRESRVDSSGSPERGADEGMPARLVVAQLSSDSKIG
jgi:hypothetical protein